MKCSHAGALHRPPAGLPKLYPAPARTLDHGFFAGEPCPPVGLRAFGSPEPVLKRPGTFFLVRGPLSVYDKSGLEDRRGAEHPRIRARRERRNGQGPRGRRDQPHRGGGDHRGARDARRPREDPPSGCARRHPRRPVDPIPSRRPCRPGHHCHRPRRVQPVPLRGSPLGRDDGHRGTCDDSGRRQELLTRHRRRPSWPTTAPCSTNCAGTVR